MEEASYGIEGAYFRDIGLCAKDLTREQERELFRDLGRETVDVRLCPINGEAFAYFPGNCLGITGVSSRGLKRGIESTVRKVQALGILEDYVVDGERDFFVYLEPEATSKFWMKRKARGKGPMRRRVMFRTPEGEEVRKQIIEANLRLIPFVLRGRGIWPGEESYPKSVQEATFGLIRAVDDFKYRLGFRFSTYADFAISGELNNILKKRKPKNLRLKEVPFSDLSESDISAIFSREDKSEERTSDGIDLQNLLKRLPQRQRRVLELRYLEEGLTGVRFLTKVGDVMNLSRERVRQIEKAAIATLRAMMARDLIS